MGVTRQIVLQFALANIVFAACYTHNGTDRNSISPDKGNNYSPCLQNEHSMCCRLKNDPYTDTCRQDGLCWNAQRGQLWRESCTDPTWQSPNCLKLCVDPIPGNIDGSGTQWLMSENDVQVTECTNGSFCCGADKDAQTCCNEGRGLWIVNGQVTNSTASASPSTPPTTSPASSSSPSTMPTSSSTPEATTSNDTAKTIGGAVGGTLGGIAVLSLVAFYLYRRRRTRSNANQGESANTAYSQLDSKTHHSPQPYELQTQNLPELQTQTRYELHGQDHYELDGSRRS
ncbi:uncharacterized protein CTRU02_202918 [Colletotrichum truncatum]|uniref:Uncharacterized protein n=1 Tax=Colletotrichum truncatum TaxID=5467 RepID=A0ACC3ZLP7_COLTU|nr:uncharacterized protein CTRU02_13012 [Colletotrichum truncatum]KAF6783996.1 hypothetical protein CTRU02_13012 [Colletotrichum truncatum]